MHQKVYPVFAKEPVRDMQQLGIQDSRQKIAYSKMIDKGKRMV